MTHLYDNTINISDDNDGSTNGNNVNAEEMDISEQNFDGLMENIEQIMTDVIIKDERDITIDDEQDNCFIEKIHEYALVDVWEAGTVQLIEMNPKEERMNAEKRIKRKHDVLKFIIENINQMKIESSSMNVGKEKTIVTPAPWSIFYDINMNRCTM